MSAPTVEPRTISWGSTPCAHCLRVPAQALLAGLPVCLPCVEVQLDEWQAEAFLAGRLDRSIEAEHRAEERPSRLPAWRPAPQVMEVCRHCRRTQLVVAWLAREGWPKDCPLCRWRW